MKNERTRKSAVVFNEKHNVFLLKLFALVLKNGNEMKIRNYFWKRNFQPKLLFISLLPLLWKRNSRVLNLFRCFTVPGCVFALSNENVLNISTMPQVLINQMLMPVKMNKSEQN